MLLSYVHYSHACICGCDDLFHGKEEYSLPKPGTLKSGNEPTSCAPTIFDISLFGVCNVTGGGDRSTDGWTDRMDGWLIKAFGSILDNWLGHVSFFTSCTYAPFAMPGFFNSLYNIPPPFELLVFILFLLQLVDLSFLSASAIFRMLVALLVFEPGLVVGSLNPRMDACKQTHGSFVLHQDFGYLSI